MPPDSFIPTRESLLGRLKNWDDQASWQEFANTYGRLIRGAAFKSGLTETEAEEVVQETFLAVAKNIGEFKYSPEKCSFKSWLLLITKQRIIWQLRKRPPTAVSQAPTPDDTARTATIERIPDGAGAALDAQWDQEWQENLLGAARERVKRQVSAKQFQIFDLYALQNWAARDVARTLKVNVAQVYLARHRVGALIKKEIARLERERE
jgi:RNA polymerase sigma-70 factor (ECF subfamily)